MVVTHGMTFPGRQESFAYDVVFVLDRSASAGADTTKAMDDYISLLSDNGLTIKTGVVCFYYEAIVMKDLSTDEIDYESINNLTFSSYIVFSKKRKNNSIF